LDRFSPYRHYTPQQHIERRRQDRADRKRRNACHGGAECFGKWLAIVKLSVPFVLVVLWLFRVI